ncbi:hypothetical protein [Aeromonas veronii]|uniref:hypothetical protein n=1 Tax=Aeromonas veronii TaxID=654 RepID=UPI001FCF8EDC|nr:hypothetical protein [Aeromonas veronii]MCJ7977003.1 hypothetical protein [Aeromonas veronii]
MFGYEQIHQYSSNSDGCRLLSPVSSALAIAIAGELAQIQVTGKVARLLFKGDAATAWDKSILQEVTIHALFALFAVPTSHPVFP